MFHLFHFVEIILYLFIHYEKFIVKIIQLYYDDNYEEYKFVKEEEITNIVCI